MRKTITVVLEIEVEDNMPECDDDIQSIIDNSDISLCQGIEITVTDFREGNEFDKKPEHFSDDELTMRGLPRFAYVELHDHVGLIKRGEMGYYAKGKVDFPVDELNRLLGVTKAQAEAMQIGSMAGWGAPGAYPERHMK